MFCVSRNIFQHYVRGNSGKTVAAYYQLAEQQGTAAGGGMRGSGQWFYDFESVTLTTVLCLTKTHTFIFCHIENDYTYFNRANKSFKGSTTKRNKIQEKHKVINYESTKKNWLLYDRVHFDIFVLPFFNDYIIFLSKYFYNYYYHCKY